MISSMTQWHPIFAKLLRPAVEGYYDVQTTVPVGDSPREADCVVLRRLQNAKPPFQGLWKHFTTWNVVEYKGPTVTPRSEHVESLIELGLGIDRRLRHQHSPGSLPLPKPEEVSFWYVASRLSRRFLQNVERKLGPLENLGPGLWRCQCLGRLVFWISSVDLPVEPESLLLHIIGPEPMAHAQEVARVVLENPNLQVPYSSVLAALHPATWKEIEVMAKRSGSQLPFDIRPAVELFGMRRIVDQVGLGKVIEQVGMDRVIREIGMPRVIREVGLPQVLKEFTMSDIVANLSAKDRRELKLLLQ